MVSFTKVASWGVYMLSFPMTFSKITVATKLILLEFTESLRATICRKCLKTAISKNYEI